MIVRLAHDNRVLVTVEASDDALAEVRPVLRFLQVDVIPVLANVPAYPAFDADTLDDLLCDVIPCYALASTLREEAATQFIVQRALTEAALARA